MGNKGDRSSQALWEPWSNCANWIHHVDFKQVLQKWKKYIFMQFPYIFDMQVVRVKLLWESGPVIFMPFDPSIIV